MNKKKLTIELNSFLNPLRKPMITDIERNTKIQKKIINVCILYNNNNNQFIFQKKKILLKYIKGTSFLKYDLRIYCILRIII